MPPVAVPKSVDLFNRAADLKLGDVDAAMQLRFQLMQEVRRQPAEPGLHVALSKACRIAGFRDEAMKHLGLAKPLLPRSDLAARVNTLINLVYLGQGHRALGVIEEALHSSPETIARSVEDSIAYCAFMAGDLDLLEEVASRERTAGIDGDGTDVLDILDQLGLRPAFPLVQRAICEILADVQIEAVYGFSEHPEDGRPFIDLTIYIDGSKAHRFDVADRLQDRLAAVFADFPDLARDWWWRYMVTVHAAPRHPSIPAAPRGILAA